MNMFIEKFYDLGDVQEIVPVPQRPDYMVITSAGKYALRTLKFPSWMERMYHDHAFTDYLTQQGYPARRIIETREGSIVCNLEGTTYFLVEYFDGSVVPDSRRRLPEAQLVQAGYRLADLHKLSDYYQGPRSQRVPTRSEKCYRTFLKVAECIATKYERDDFDDLSMMAARRKMEYVAKNPFERERFMTLPRITNHGDYHAGNLVFDSSDRIVAVLDFEFCTEMPRVWDVAWALSWLCRERPTEAFCGRMNIKSLETFLSSYNEIYPLSHQEQIDLNKVGVSSCLHATYFLSHFYLQNKSPYQLEKCQDLEEWFWWADHEDELQDIIFKSCAGCSGVKSRQSL